MNVSSWMGVGGGMLLVLTAGCLFDRQGEEGRFIGPGAVVRVAPASQPRSGTWLDVRLIDAMGSATSHIGDTWRGILRRDIPLQNGERVQAGSAVDGIVSGVRRSRDGAARLELRVITISTSGHLIPVRTETRRALSSRDVGAASGHPSGNATRDVALSQGSVLLFHVP